MTSIEYGEAAVEVLEILKNTNKQDVEKIPENFIQHLNDISSKTYKPTIDFSKPLEKMNLRDKTIDILAIICSKYWCDGIKKIEFINILDINDKIKQENLNEKYNSSNLFKNRKIINSQKELALIENRENFISKVLKFLKLRKN